MDFHVTQQPRLVYAWEGEVEKLQADVLRLEGGIREILEYINADPPRIEDASFICEVLLAK